MIDVQDLRIGNLFHYWPAGSEKVIDKVYALRTTSKTFSQLLIKGEKSGWNQETQCHPIELTPEILEAAGLVEKEEPYSFLCTHFIMVGNGGNLKRKGARWITQNMSGSKIETAFLRIDGITDLFYLHQLQNLYHSLTGEEIKIKLPTTGKE